MKNETLKLKEAIANQPKILENILKNFISEVKKESEKENSELIKIKNTVVSINSFKKK